MTNMTEEESACVNGSVKAGVLKAARVDAAAQTEEQNAMARPPMLPGTSTAPRQKSNASRRIRNRGRSEANMDHTLDGDWQAVDVSSPNKWLHRFFIFGP